MDAKGNEVPSETSTITSGLGNAWGSVSYDGQDYDAGGTRSDFDGDSGSFTAGVDWRINDKLVLGLVLDGTRSDQDGTGFSSDIDSLRAAVYGTWGEETGFYSDFLAGYGDHSIESTRNLGALLGGVSNVDSDASSIQALLTAGYTMTYRNLKHGPFAGLEYQNVDVDGFNQGGFLPLTVGDHEVDSLRALIGYRVDAEYGKFRPYASVAYAHEFEDGANTAPASFAGVPFSVSGEEQSSALLVTAGTGIALTSSLTLDIGYRGDIATDDGMISHGGSIGLNFAF
jgi:outer membrane lipase/esterase